MKKLQNLGWNDFFAEQIGDDDTLAPARVSAEGGATLLVRDATGERPARPRGALSRTSPRPAVGDWVLVEEAGPGEPPSVVRLLQRRTTLARKAAGRSTVEQVLAANVDLVFLVVGLDGDFNLRRVERTLVAVWESGASPVVLLNKADLSPHPEGRLSEVMAVAPGVDVHLLSALHGDGLEVVQSSLGAGRTAILVGSSGAGKSTILNRILGEEKQRTTPVREGDSRGRHTTSARRLFSLPRGGWLIDGPGIRELALWHGEEGMAATFRDVADLARSCRFVDCRHVSEPGCSVLAAVERGELSAERLASFHKLERELARIAAKQDGAVRSAEAKRWKTIKRDVKVLRKIRGH